MDNQCTKQIKKFLTDKDCELMLVEPHNHRVNAAERAIQTFKDHFISALATTDSKFPLQLWDRLTSQVETTLNLMRAVDIGLLDLVILGVHRVAVSVFSCAVGEEC